MNKESVEAGIKAVKTRKARYAIFKVDKQPDQPLQIVLEKQSERKATKEESGHTTTHTHAQRHDAAVQRRITMARAQSLLCVCRFSLSSVSVCAAAVSLSFYKDLLETQGRFCLYDYEFKTDDGRATSTLFFIYWYERCSRIASEQCSDLG